MIAREYMEIALQEAELAIKHGDVPVGALIVRKDEIIAKAHNEVEASNDALAHSELLVLRAAMQKLGTKHLQDCELYVTLEPCAMCAGAIVLARINRVYIGADDPKMGASGSVYNILQDERLNHRCEVYHNITHDKCSKLLSDFFEELRNNRKIKYDE
ncbi:MAG: nucleoside deaminase [Ignavibacteria bacterium]|jgi:tRNA(adenine34) deaminase|nr:nucleoside deaminase [Ignavibacteria bacterium]